MRGTSLGFATTARTLAQRGIVISDSAAARRSTALGDLRLFLTTFIAGFLFVTILLA